MRKIPIPGGNFVKIIRKFSSSLTANKPAKENPIRNPSTKKSVAIVMYTQ